MGVVPFNTKTSLKVFPYAKIDKTKKKQLAATSLSQVMGL